MQINFDSANLRQHEAQGIILLLSALFPALNSQPVSNPIPTTTEEQAIFGTPIPAATPISLQTAIDSTSDPVPTTEAPTRKRRTKAEIAADEAAAKQATGSTPAAEAQATAATPVVEAQASASVPSKPIDADTLRGLLNAYIAAHSMEEAIAILQAFGCNRVTEALALDPAKLAELAGRLQE